jgi:hypothetical protein
LYFRLSLASASRRFHMMVAIEAPLLYCHSFTLIDDAIERHYFQPEPADYAIDAIRIIHYAISRHYAIDTPLRHCIVFHY